MPLLIARKDITTLPSDAIVNAANTALKNYALRRGGGVCGAIFRAAGNDEMQAACDAIGGCETGSAVVTPAFRLPARYVIHAVGPRYENGNAAQEALLFRCYGSALDIAAGLGLRTVAFPLISSGIYGYPGEEALSIALNAIRGWLASHGDAIEVTLCLMDEALYRTAQDAIRNG